MGENVTMFEEMCQHADQDFPPQAFQRDATTKFQHCQLVHCVKMVWRSQMVLGISANYWLTSTQVKRDQRPCVDRHPPSVH